MVHLIVGVLVFVAALGLFTAAMRARVAVITLAALSIVVNFAWIPYYPWWAILVIALSVVVMWTVATWEPRDI
ncbi:hypothetical protein ACLBYD_15770 [Rhodococcus sp. C26F]